MAVLTWDGVGERLFETGLDKGVLYVMDGSGDYPAGVAWNGLVSVQEAPSGAEKTPLYADNTKYLELISTEEFSFTLEAYTYPDEFGVCDGSVAAAAGTYIGQQPRSKFGLVYRTRIGNDVAGDQLGYKLHLIYGCLASPSAKPYQTVNDSPEAITFSWEVSTTPEAVTGEAPSAIVTIDSRTADPTSLAALQLVLFGDVATPASLPHIDAVISALTP